MCIRAQASELSIQSVEALESLSGRQRREPPQACPSSIGAVSRIDIRAGIHDPDATAAHGGAGPWWVCSISRRCTAARYESVARRAEETEWSGQTISVASLESLVGFKRLARRPQDRIDLAELEAIRGELAIEPIPGLDD